MVATKEGQETSLGACGALDSAKTQVVDPLLDDDRIVLTALSGMTGGIEFRDVAFTARIGDDGYVHAISVTGTTADGSRTLLVKARMFGFGRPVRVAIPGEGTFVDQKTIALAE